MKDKAQIAILGKLLVSSQSRGKMWVSLSALFFGSFLLLLSVSLWWNFNELLYGHGSGEKLGSTFLVIGKKVTNENMGRPGATIFTEPEIDSVSRAPQVQGVGIISSNHFPVYALMGGNLSFATDLPLESVPDSFIDNLPTDWNWQPGNRQLPIILSNQFLDIYNYVFAPSQGLPQLSQSSLKVLGITLKAGTEAHNEVFTGHVVGFSDRINSVMVPQSFIDYGNRTFGFSNAGFAPSRLIIKTKDPSDRNFAAYLEKHNYTTNAENMRWSKVRAIVEVVSSAVGGLALVILAIAVLVFVLFVELTVTKARESLLLLTGIGYSPAYLSKFMIRKFLPKALTAQALSIMAVLVMQVLAGIFGKGRNLDLALLPGWPVWAAAVFMLLIVTRLVWRAISRAVIHS